MVSMRIMGPIFGFGIITLSCITTQGCKKESAGQSVVVLRAASGKEIAVQVEVASRPEERERGLMFRRELADNAGMLFVYPAEAPLSFWMKNTYLPLDMIFINNSMRIVGVVENAEPLTLEARTVDAEARYVLEVNGFFLRRHGILPGSRVRFEGIEN